jgi:hypothetical protein
VDLLYSMQQIFRGKGKLTQDLAILQKKCYFDKNKFENIMEENN